jgi:hypothetical protein
MSVGSGDPGDTGELVEAGGSGVSGGERWEGKVRREGGSGWPGGMVCLNVWEGGPGGSDGVDK